MEQIDQNQSMDSYKVFPSCLSEADSVLRPSDLETWGGFGLSFFDISRSLYGDSVSTFYDAFQYFSSHDAVNGSDFKLTTPTVLRVL